MKEDRKKRICEIINGADGERRLVIIERVLKGHHHPILIFALVVQAGVEDGVMEVEVVCCEVIVAPRGGCSGGCGGGIEIAIIFWVIALLHRLLFARCDLQKLGVCAVKEAAARVDLGIGVVDGHIFGRTAGDGDGLDVDGLEIGVANCDNIEVFVI